MAACASWRASLHASWRGRPEGHVWAYRLCPLLPTRCSVAFFQGASTATSPSLPLFSSHPPSPPTFPVATHYLPLALPAPVLCARARLAALVPKAASPSPGTPCQRELTPPVPASSEEHCSPHFPLPPVCHHCRVAELQPAAPRHIRTHTQRAALPLPPLPALSCSASAGEGGGPAKVSAGKEGDAVSFLAGPHPGIALRPCPAG